MDFARKGMRSAQPRFAEWPGMYSGVPRERVGGILKDAEHWRNDARGIDHPDAMLIVASPDLLGALQAVMGEWRHGYGLSCEEQCRAAISKATGGAS